MLQLPIKQIEVIRMLIVETGAIIPDADSFLSLVDARSLAEKYGVTLPTDDTEVEVALRQGYLNLLQRERTLQGSRINSIQTGIYPRSGVLNNCFPVDEDAIPNDVKMAQLYATDAIISGADTNNVDGGEKLASFSVDGVYSETYQTGSKTTTNQVIQGVINSLYPLTIAGFQASPCGGGNGGLTRENMGFL